MEPDGTVDTGLGMAKAPTQETNSFNWTNMIPAGVGGILDILTSKQQFDRQRKLNRENQQLQLEMWEKTNYPAQRAMMEKAGLNPALMYGQGGGGGTTTGTQGSNVGQTQGTFTGMGLQMQQQMQLIEAQKNNIEADTKKKQVEAAKLAGIDTELGTEGLTGQKLDNKLKQETLDYKINQAFQENRKAIGEADIKGAEANIANSTIATKIQGIKLDNIIKNLDIALKESGIELNKATIQNMAEQIKLGKFNSNQNAEYKGINQVLGGTLNKILNTLAAMIGLDDDMFIDKTK